MKIYNLDGSTGKWKLQGYRLGTKPTKLCSEGHLLARELLTKLFPTDIILEEIPIPELGLRLDFFIPTRKLAIEIDGQQHAHYTPFFHQTKQKFYHAQANDRRKTDWCELNDITLLRLNDNEKDKWEWIIQN